MTNGTMGGLAVRRLIAVAAMVIGMTAPAMALDGDGDGIDDAIDPCNNTAPTSMGNVSLAVTNLLTPAGDDSLSFKGTVTQVPSMVPISFSANGFRVLLTDSAGATLDLVVPPGHYNGSVGWKSTGSGVLYKNDGKTVPRVNGIYKVKINRRTTSLGTIKFAVSGKGGTYALDTAQLPITATAVFAPPLATNGQCGEATTACVATGGGNNLKCR